MMDRYASAALIAAVLHAVAIALVIVFSFGVRVAPPTPLTFLVLSSPGGAEEIADLPVRVSVPSLPKRVPVPTPEPRLPRETASKNSEAPKPSVPHAAPQANRPPAARMPVAPARSTNPGVARNVLPTSIPRVSETWDLAPGSAVKRNVAQAARSGDASTAATEREAYLAELRRRLLAALQIPAGLGTELETRVEMLLGADGTLSDAVIVRSSGSVDFDRAVLAAVKRTRMPPPPNGRSEQIVVPFSTVELAR